MWRRRWTPGAGLSTSLQRVPALDTPLMTDLIIRGGTIMNAKERRRADIAITGGQITEIAEGLTGSATEELDARGLFVMPGLIDVHLHFNEPGHTDWEGAVTGSHALAAG